MPVCMPEDRGGNKCGLLSLFSLPDLQLIISIHLLQVHRQHIHFFFVTHFVITKKLPHLLHCWNAAFLFCPFPPKSPSAVLFSSVRVSTLVIPEIPDCEIQKYFSTRALIYRYVCIINMPLLFLHCGQRSERIVLCCQINTLLIFIRLVTHCVPLTLNAGFNTNTKNDVASGE